ncbi:MAG: glycoside hydrolase family 97 catalytic domain-containing protein, partial [Bacteroidales bacterium]|nr:glycoside hydrolase family 97 catalytic domain-containing protein [Bacteroidales bacterium]
MTALLLVFSCSSPVLDSPDGMLSVMMEDNELVILHQGNPVQTIEMPSGPFIGTSRAKADGASARIFKCDSTDIEVRVYDTGVAYRFLNGERKVAYVIPDGMKRWLGYYGFTGYEALFPESSSCVPGKWIYPALVEYGDGLFGFIAEAGIERGHSCSHLVSTDDSGRYCLETTDEETEYNVTPWRFVLVGELSDIAESTMVTDLSAPCKLEDTSWIKPGLSSWIYWAYNHGSKDYDIITDYIDLAAEMGWPYCLVDWEWPDMEGGKTIDDVIAYADEKGVRLNLWYNSGTSWTGPGSPQPEDRLRTAGAREEEFSWLESKGIAGVKVDFFSEDGADMVNYYIDILEDAARHHLLVDFHGCTIPRGWQRTYPNLMSMEAVYG